MSLVADKPTPEPARGLASHVAAAVRAWWRRHWYRSCTFLAVLFPALAAQSFFPIIPQSAWEMVGESVYATLLGYQSPDVAKPSRVMLLEVDQRTLDAYGWPIDRGYYATMLAKLQSSGHPWVLSLLQFQALEKAKQTAEDKSAAKSRDEALAAAIKGYGRYVGSGLEIRSGAELTPDQEERLLPSITLTKAGAVPELPYLPLRLIEDQSFVEAQRAFGFGTHFGLSPVIRCMQFYITDAAHSGAFVIPSSLAWAATYAREARMATMSGASWPRSSDVPPAGTAEALQLGYKHCLSSPGLVTRDFLTQRRIERVSLADFIESDRRQSLEGKVVILARADMRRFRGPGSATATDDGVVEEQLLAARFLDDLLTDQAIRREDASRVRFMTSLPLILAAALFAVAIFVSPFGAVFSALIVLGGLAGLAGFNLARGAYLMPLEAMASMAFTAAFLSLLYAYLLFHCMRREVRLADGLRRQLSASNTLESLEEGIREVWRVEFPNGDVDLVDYDRELYAAAGDPSALLALLERRKRGHYELPKPAAFDTVVSRMTKRIGRTPASARSFSLKLAVDSPSGRLGAVRLSCSFAAHEERLVAQFVNIMKLEVSEHWHRIKMLVDQKLLDYKVLAEQSRVEILERFLTKVLVAKFSDDFTMEENLRTVLTPRTTRAALMQADIRGYSRVSANMEPLEMARLLQGYFRNVVDAAQTVAQVKLIGDCIFLFIEEDAGKDGASPTDLALELAAILIDETRAQNAIRAKSGGEELNFGIAIHYGEVVVGNLSSDSCIDYTVISPNVNLVARLEEVTKNPGIARAIGANGIILSEEAAKALRKYQNASLPLLRLDEIGVTVRSFPNVKTVRGLSADEALILLPSKVGAA